MPSSHLILCCPFLLLPLIPPSIKVFSNESTLHMRWPKYWSFSFSISPSKENPVHICIIQLVKESTYNAGDPGLIPGLGRSPGEAIGYPLQYSWASLMAQRVESARSAGDLGLIPESGRSPGEGNGNPLQYSCLENPVEGGAW